MRGARLPGCQPLLRSRQRSLATATMEHDATGTVLWELCCIESRQRKEQRAGDALGGVFERFAHVDQQDLTRFEQSGDFGRLQRLDRMAWMTHLVVPPLLEQIRTRSSNRPAARARCDR